MKTPEEFALGWEPGERWRAQHTSCATASGLHSGSMLTSYREGLITVSNPLILSLRVDHKVEEWQERSVEHLRDQKWPN